MNPLKWLAVALLIPFTVLTVYAVMQVGYLGIFDYHRHSPAGWQVFVDLVIALVLILVWMQRDAQRRGRAFVPYLIVTLAAGSFGPLLYLLLGKSDTSAGSR
ncbi:MAG: hypothetical protein DWQ36_19430 [Acidobacteria bacterium]|nr:MAG: hypothetical protein DWQ30_06210 [Acidobacteriota bacterium]REK03715.1 MAG: hypothetical protein DWQ36_19430 [Acidobacteriota bacterium]